MKLGFWLAAPVLIYLAILALAYVLQRPLQYQPGRADPDPATLGLAGVQRVILTAPDGVPLVLWYAKAAPGRPTILFFHGNAGDLTDRAARMQFYQAQGFGAAFLSYRGFGGSGGSVSEAGLMMDARTAYDRLLGQTDRIVLVGESLGTGVAVQLAAQVPVLAVALDAPYSSTLAVAQGRFAFLPVAWLMWDQFRSTDHIARIAAPLLIQHGTADMVIPFRLGQDLFDAAHDPKTLIPLPGRGHEVIFAADVWQRQTAFFDLHVPRAATLATPPAAP